MLSRYFAAFVALSATTTTVLSAPVKEARDIESHISPRNFYWQCPQGQSFIGNAPPSLNSGACTSCQAGTFSSEGVNCYTTPQGFYNDKAGARNPIGCLAGTFTGSTGSKICQPCISPFMSSAAATKCGPCADGTSSSDGIACTACTAGTFSVGGAACNTCQPGTFFAGGACHVTPAGFYNDKPGAGDPIGCLAGMYSDTTGAIACKACTLPFMSSAAATKCIPCADGSSSSDSIYCTRACPSGTFSVGGAACNTCQPGTFFAGGACHSTPVGFYNDRAGSADPVGCLAGTYTDTTGAIICKACVVPLMSHAASAKCIPCADGSTSTDAQYCHACPAGQSSTGGAACSSGNYHILIRDSSDKNTLGYLSLNENRVGIYYITDLADALTIASPTFGSGGPVPLVASTESGTSGYNLAIGLGIYGDDFSSSSRSYIWISESQSDSKNEYFASNDDWPLGMAEPNVWVLGSADANSRYPISLNFVGPNRSIITCARFFNYVTEVGATCSNDGGAPFGTTVLLFLVPA